MLCAGGSERSLGGAKARRLASLSAQRSQALCQTLACGLRLLCRESLGTDCLILACRAQARLWPLACPSCSCCTARRLAVMPPIPGRQERAARAERKGARLSERSSWSQPGSSPCRSEPTIPCNSHTWPASTHRCCTSSFTASLRAQMGRMITASGAHGFHSAAAQPSVEIGRASEVKLVMGLQVCEHLQRVAKPLGVWVAPIVGGISPAKQTRLLGRQPQVCSFSFPVPTKTLWLRQQLPSWVASPPQSRPASWAASRRYPPSLPPDTPSGSGSSSVLASRCACTTPFLPQ